MLGGMCACLAHGYGKRPWLMVPRSLAVTHNSIRYIHSVSYNASRVILVALWSRLVTEKVHL